MIKVNNVIIEPKFFPDGTFNLMNFPKVKTWNFFGESEIEVSWYFENISEQILLYNVVKHLKNTSYSDIDLWMFYVPNARMDRVYKIDSEVPTLKFFADFINDLKFKAVSILDPHSDVTQMLLDRCHVINRACIENFVIKESKPDVIMYPDTGAVKRYSKEINLPFIYGEKTRDWKTGKITGLELHNPQNIQIRSQTKVLISDDICSKGGTFYYAAKALKEKFGVERIDLYVTHCERSIKDGELLKEGSPINHVYTTDSIIRHFASPKITTFSIEEILHV